MTCCPLAIKPCGSCQAVRWKRLVHNSDFRVFSCLLLLLFASAILYSSHYSVLKHRSISVVKNQLKLCFSKDQENERMFSSICPCFWPLLWFQSIIYGFWQRSETDLHIFAWKMFAVCQVYILKTESSAWIFRRAQHIMCGQCSLFFWKPVLCFLITT